jgi:hypothetical protein
LIDLIKQLENFQGLTALEVFFCFLFYTGFVAESVYKQPPEVKNIFQ